MGIAAYNGSMGTPYRALFFLALFLPLSVSAASIPAGFAPGALWLSSTQATAGDSLKVYTVLYDSADVPLQADVAFNVDAVPFSTITVSLAAGQSQIVAADWTAVAGAHAFDATLKNVTGVAGAVANSTNVVGITVAAARPSPIAQYSSIVNNLYASSSPQMQNVVQAIASTTEGWRLSGETAIVRALANTTSSASRGQVLGAETYRAPPAATASIAPGTLERLWRAFLGALLYVFQIRWLFYFALLAIAYTVFKIIQGLFRYRR